jgi:hypothetical protein
MAVFDEKQDELEHYETMMGVPRGRLAVTIPASPCSTSRS